MSKEKACALALLAGIALTGVLAGRDADAIPAFARRYRFSCSTCHAPFPRLKPFGEEFAARGFRLPADQEPTRAYIDTGDPWLLLNRELPLAVRLEGYGVWRENSGVDEDFQWPWAFKLLSGGPVSKNVSYYFYGIMESGETLKLEDTYLQFNSVFHLPVDVIFGQFQVSDVLFKRELRLERNDYQIYKERVGLVPSDLTYDRGLVFTWRAPAQLDVQFQVVNGNGIEPAVDRRFDNNGYKNTSLHLGRTFGPVRVGVFGYYGRIGTSIGTNTTTYVGPDLAAALGENWQLNLQYLERRDTDPYFVADPGPDYVMRGGFAELLYFPQGQDGRWALVGLYNRITRKRGSAPGFENASVTASYLLARNVRLVAEATRDIEAEANSISFGVVTAF